MIDRENYYRRWLQYGEINSMLESIERRIERKVAKAKE